MVAIEVLGCILEFAIDGLVEILQEFGACRFRSAEVRFQIVDEHSQALRSEAEFRRARAVLLRPFQPGVTEVHLRAASRWVA